MSIDESSFSQVYIDCGRQFKETGRHLAGCPNGPVPALRASETTPSEFREDDCEIVVRKAERGGQHTGHIDTSVTIRHRPTDVVVTCSDHHSQHRNKLENAISAAIGFRLGEQGVRSLEWLFANLPSLLAADADNKRLTPELAEANDRAAEYEGERNEAGRLAVAADADRRRLEHEWNPRFSRLMDACGWDISFNIDRTIDDMCGKLRSAIAADADRQRYAFLKRWLRAEPGHEDEMPEGWLVFSSHDFDAAIDDRICAARSPEGEPNAEAT